MRAAKKTYLLPQKLIDEMKRTFGTKTETSAIINAMEEVAFWKKILTWHKKNAGRMKIRDLYAR